MEIPEAERTEYMRELEKEIGEIKAKLSGLCAEVSSLRERIDDIVITQLKDHGKRLSMLEKRQVWVGGWIAGAGAAGAAVAWILSKVIAF